MIFSQPINFVCEQDKDCGFLVAEVTFGGQ